MLESAQFQRRFSLALIQGRRPRALAVPAFAVYRNTWVKALLDALDANFPVVAALLGPELFKTVSVSYAKAHPASSPILALYGDEFPDALANHEISRELPYLSDVARLERLWTECFFASDAAEFGSSDCGRITPKELLEAKPRLHPATRFARFATPAVTIWQAHRATGEFEEIEPDWVAEHALVTRRGMQVSVTLIDEATLALLEAIRRGLTIGDAIAETAVAHRDYDLAGALASILSSAALTAHRPEDERIW
jgi:hypothetical protein